LAFQPSSNLIQCGLPPIDFSTVPCIPLLKMSIQLIGKRLMTNQVTLSLHRLSMASYLLPRLHFVQKPHNFFANFCTEIADASTTPDMAVATEFLINKCGLTDAEITKAFRHCNSYLRAKSPSQNMEEVLELLKGCGLTTPAQIRLVVLGNPHIFFHRAERNLKPKLSFLGTFMKKEDIAKLMSISPDIFNFSEGRHKSAISLLQNLGIEGEALSELLARQPRLLTTSEEKVIESFKQAEDLGFKKGSKMFAIALRSILGLGEENLNRRRQFLISLGFSENEVSDLCRKRPSILCQNEEKVKRNVDFVVNIVGLPLADLVKYPNLFGYRVETRMIPRYRVMEALKSMHVQVPKKKEASIFMLTEKRFLENYVYSNSESSSLLLDIYKETCGECISDKVIHETC